MSRVEELKQELALAEAEDAYAKAKAKAYESNPPKKGAAFEKAQAAVLAARKAYREANGR